MPPFVGAQIIVAHRGASYDAPENTLAAFKLAWQQGADAIEADFRLTSDRQIVCIHDQTTKRVTRHEVTVKEATYDALKGLDVGSWKHESYSRERIPKLEQVLSIVPVGKLIYIELKSGPEIIRPLQKILAASHLKSNQTVIISFKRDVIRLCKQLMPERRAYWLVAFPHEKEPHKWQPTSEEMIRIAKEIDADGLDIEINEAKATKTFAVVTEPFAREAKKAGLSLHSWTVDNPDLARKLVAMGFDSITTNRPSLYASKDQPKSVDSLRTTNVKNDGSDARSKRSLVPATSQN